MLAIDTTDYHPFIKQSSLFGGFQLEGLKTCVTWLAKSWITPKQNFL